MADKKKNVSIFLSAQENLVINVVILCAVWNVNGAETYSNNKFKKKSPWVPSLDVWMASLSTYHSSCK